MVVLLSSVTKSHFRPCNPPSWLGDLTGESKLVTRGTLCFSTFPTLDLLDLRHSVSRTGFAQATRLQL